MCIYLYIGNSGSREKRKLWRKGRVKFQRYTEIPTTSSPRVIPRFYRVFFTVLDPILSVFGAIMHTSPTSILPNYSVNPILPPATETRLLLDALIGFFLFLAFLQAVLLRARPHDLGVWKILQAGILIVDLFMVLAFARALSNTGRMDASSWRPEEWRNIGVNVSVAIVRMAFVLGIGMNENMKHE